jgi:hypothetical protein
MNLVLTKADGSRLYFDIPPGPGSGEVRVRPFRFPVVSTRLKFRKKRLVRIATAAVRASLQDYIGKPRDIEVFHSAADTAFETMREVSARYAHLRK